MPSTPQALPTIFWANVKPCFFCPLFIDSIKIFVAPRPNVFLDFSVNPLPIISETLPPALTSSRSVFGLMSKLDKTLLLSSEIFPFEKSISIMSPVLKFETSHSMGIAPESSAVLKKIGAIFPPNMTPSVFLFGT